MLFNFPYKSVDFVAFTWNCGHWAPSWIFRKPLQVFMWLWHVVCHHVVAPPRPIYSLSSFTQYYYLGLVHLPITCNRISRWMMMVGGAVSLFNHIVELCEWENTATCCARPVSVTSGSMACPQIFIFSNMHDKRPFYQWLSLCFCR